jgi:hypothetical protein
MDEQTNQTKPIEEDLQKELEAVKVSIVFISSNLWFYQVLFVT